ncbi:MAG: caspase family protein [Gemmatimonadota bacterium]
MRRFPSIALMATLLPLLAFGPAERIAPTHWALIVGISDYINFDDVEGGDLPGAEHDARAVRDVLVGRFGFPAENVRMILNRDATRAAIQEGITEWLASRARPGDNVVVFYAGHGSQMWDESGDEDDGLDETLAPADVLPTSTEFDISDDTFGSWLNQLPTNNVVVVLDNCNSGTGTRDVTPFSRSRRLGRDINAIPKPATVSRRALPGQEDRTGFNAMGAQVLELAAAQPNQAAVDAFFPAENGGEPFHGGAFTTFLVRTLWRAPGDATYEDVFSQVREALKRNRFQQDPHLSEDVPLKDLSLFFVEGGAVESADATLPVESVENGMAVLQGGQTLGITSGSVFRTESGATLLVESVTQGASTARIASGNVAAGDRARLVGYRYAITPLLVNVAGVDTRTAQALAQDLGGTHAIRLVEEPDAFSHLLLRRRGGFLRVVGSDGFVRHDSLPATDEGARKVAAYLRQEAAAKRLADMENPAQPFGVTIEMEGGKTSFGIGEKVSFHATSQQDGYLTLVDLGTDGKVVMLFPNEHQPATPIRAGETLSFPTDDMDFELQIFPPAGRGMVRAFVTPRPLDIEITGEYPEGDERFAETIAQAVMQAAGTVEGAVRLDTWGTASLVYDIHN